MELAVRALHKAFDLEQGSQAAGAPFSKRILHIAYSSGTVMG